MDAARPSADSAARRRPAPVFAASFDAAAPAGAVSPGDEAAAGLQYQRIVVKAGSGILAGGGPGGPHPDGLNMAVLSSLAGQLAALRRARCEVLLVTSGAIAVGRAALGSLNAGAGQRDVQSRQIAAAVGQSRLMQTYQELFAVEGVLVAQTLLTTADLSHRPSYLNVRNTLRGLLELGIIPILNENDVVAVDEIGEVFGDNDRLSALVANLVDADLLLILTDIDGLYSADPRLDPSATRLDYVEQVDAGVEAMAGRHRQPWARGGMPTKLDAARLVTTAGIPMVLCDGRNPGAALRAAAGQPVGTFFRPAAEKLEARKRSMLGDAAAHHRVTVDAGAAAALQQQRRSLLPAGVCAVDGGFQRGDTIYIVSERGERLACGIANYGAAEIERIRGRRSGQIEATLGYQFGEEIVHRNNLVLL